VAVALRGYLAPSNSGTAGVTSQATQYTGWTTAGASNGDLVLVIFLVTASGLTFTQSAGTGTWTITSSDSNAATNAPFTSMLAYKTYATGDTAPTFSWGTSAAYAYMMLALRSTAANAPATAVFDAESSVHVITSPGTVNTPNTAVATYAADMAIILNAARYQTSGSSAISMTTPSSGFSVVALGGYAGAGGAFANSVSAYTETLSSTGTVTPGGQTFNEAVSSNSYLLLAKETFTVTAGLATGTGTARATSIGLTPPQATSFATGTGTTVITFDNFEGSTGLWNVFQTGVTGALSSGWSNDGTQSWLMTTTGVSSGIVTIETINVVPGQVLQVQAYLYSPQGYSLTRFTMDYFDYSGSNYLGGYYPASFNLPAATAGFYTSGAFTIPAGTYKVHASVGFNGTPDSTIQLYIDDASVLTPPGQGIELTPGLATGTGSVSASGIELTPGLATGTGTAQVPSTELTPGLTTGTGVSQSPSSNVQITAGLATGTGIACARFLALKNTAEGGSNTTAVTAGNSGGVSGDALTQGGVGTVTFDNSQVFAGSLAYKFVTAASLSYTGWNPCPYNPAILYMRAYIYLTNYSVGYIFRAGTGALGLLINSSGHLLAAGPGGNVTGTGTAASLNTWYRIEGMFVAGAGNAQAFVRMYDTSGTLLDSVNNAANNNVSTFGFALIGSSISNSTTTLWLDNLAASDQAWIGTGAPLVAGLAVGLTPGLATGTGAAQAPDADNQGGAGLVSGTGTAQVVGRGISSGTAGGTGTVLSPDADNQVAAGFAAGLTGPVYSGGVYGAGVYGFSLIGIGLTVGLVTGTGVSQAPDADNQAASTGLASALTEITYGGGSYGGGFYGLGITGMGLAPGLVSGIAAAQAPAPASRVIAGSVAGAGTALPPSVATMSPALEGYGFSSFPQVPAGSLIQSVIATIVQYGSNASIVAPSYELWDGTSARIGSPQMGTVSTVPGHADVVEFSGVAYSQLATLRLRVIAGTLLGNHGATVNVDAVSLSVVWLPGHSAIVFPETFNVLTAIQAPSASGIVNASVAPSTLAVASALPAATAGFEAAHIFASALSVSAVIPVPAVVADANATVHPATLAVVPAFPVITDVTSLSWATAEDLPVTAGEGAWTNAPGVIGVPDNSNAVWTVP